MRIPQLETAPSPSPLEVWGGIECTVNRVGDQYVDQIELSGHARRLDDLDMFAALGLQTLRYPALWERIAPQSLDTADWSWIDDRLARMRALGMSPIIGFVHHGSGPRHTNLLDPAFPEKLAEFALAFARRHPEVERYTPINEPLTTARFSGLYGLWYPHRRTGDAFVRALLNQCRAIILAMRAVRSVNPRAQLVQTEDIGRVFSTPRIAYQAAFENERRWLTFDLLTGHALSAPIAKYVRHMRHATNDLAWIADHVTPPDVVGMNYYVTSERFLDHRLGSYPSCTHGGNGRDKYVDVEAARVVENGIAGPLEILRETYGRYRLPIAITEVHLAGNRDDQLRWMRDVWEGAEDARAGGIDVRAITAWSLLGAYDWHNLLTRVEGRYESGAYDVRGITPRRTAVATLIRELALGKLPSHPVLSSDGWWRRPDRFVYPAYRMPGNDAALPARRRPAARPILITGATGTLGHAFGRLCRERGIEYKLVARPEMDIADPASVARALAEHKPWALINAAGYVRVDDAETDVAQCWRANADGPAILATACAQRDIAFVTFSSDLVFDGNRSAPYIETDAVAPLNTYGRSKVDAERRVQEIMPHSLIIRTSSFFGPWDAHNVVTRALDAFTMRMSFPAASDAVVSPTFIPDLVHATLDLLIDGESGFWHLVNNGALSWAEFIRRAAELADVDSSMLDGRPMHELRMSAVRPRYSALSSHRALLMPTLDDALVRFVEHRLTAAHS